MKNISKKTGFVLLLLVAALFLGLVVGRKNQPLEYYADKIIEECKSFSYKQDCYDENIPLLMKTLSMEEVFEVTGQVQSRTPEYTYCHVLGHEVAAIETKKDPSKWKDVIGRCPRGVCSNGCVHGAFQERFRKEFVQSEAEMRELEAELVDVCEERDGFNPTGLERSSCYHALGHLLMYTTGADTSKAIGVCERVAKKETGDFTPVCYDGVFMQLFQPLGEEDEELIKGKVPLKKDVKAFCDEYEGVVKASCWTESWPLFFDEIITPTGAMEFCDNLAGEARNLCFGDIFYIIPIQFRFETSAIYSYCSRLPDELGKNCIRATALRLVEIDKSNNKRAVDFCSEAPVANEACLEALSSQAADIFHPGSAEYKELCSLLPIGCEQK